MSMTESLAIAFPRSTVGHGPDGMTANEFAASLVAEPLSSAATTPASSATENLPHMVTPVHDIRYVG